MFYIGQFFKNISFNPLRGMLFIILTILLTVLVQHRTFIFNFIKDRTKVESSYPYFHVLIAEKVDSKSLVLKLKKLPGVFDVIPQSSEYLSSKVKDLIDDLDLPVPKMMLDENYSGVKVVLEQKVNNRSIQLIREYLNRLFTEDLVTMTPVKGESKKKLVIGGVELDDGALISNVIVFGILLLLVILWPFVFYRFSTEVRSRSYLIECYQRKKFVALKILLSGLFFIVIVLMFATILFRQPLILDTCLLLLFFIICSAIFARKREWKH